MMFARLVAWVLLVGCAGLAAAAPTIRQVSASGAPGGGVEIRGVQAGPFNPAFWKAGTLHWVFNDPFPMLEPRPGAFRNIYAPTIVREKGGWRMFYGAWDGVPSGNDRIYSTLTQDFRTFSDRRMLIDHGAFIHICNCSAVKLPKGGYALMATAYPDQQGMNKPSFFSSPDGLAWNGSTRYEGKMSDVVDLVGYEGYSQADINGMNTLLYEDGRYRMYFCNFKQWGTVWRATSRDGHTFRYDGAALAAPHMVNDVKRFQVAGRKWYVMGLHANGDTLWYSLSNDGLVFGRETPITGHRNAQDRYMVALGFVSDGKSLYGVVYGAGAVPSLDRNRIFAKWLQKRVVFVAGGREIEADSASGPDRVMLPAPAEGVEGHWVVYAEDGVTVLSTSPNVRLTRGSVWQVSGFGRRG